MFMLQDSPEIPDSGRTLGCFSQSPTCLFGKCCVCQATLLWKSVGKLELAGKRTRAENDQRAAEKRIKKIQSRRIALGFMWPFRVAQDIAETLSLAFQQTFSKAITSQRRKSGVFGLSASPEIVNIAVLSYHTVCNFLFLIFITNAQTD